jgi:exosortase O
MFFPRKFSSTGQAFLNARTSSLLFDVTIIALWLWLYRAMFDYLGVVVVREDFRTNQLVLLGVGALMVYQIRSHNWQLHAHVTPRFYPLPLALALAGSIAYLIVERWLDINTLSAILFGLASYGLVGLWLTPASWRQGLPAALLLIGILPFGDHMQTFIGYPMRIVTAEIVRQGLAAFHIASGGVDTILVLENGVAQIDLPCSGVKSLWTGALFLLAATWLDHRALHARWFVVAVIFAALLFVVNVLRVAALVVSAQVLNLPVLAQMLHVPLGVVGFVGACATAVALLRYCTRVHASASLSENGTWLTPARWHTPALVVVIFAMAILYTPRAQTGLTQPAPVWNFPTELQTTPRPLKPDEIAWLTRDGAESATRFRFTWQGISGSMILVPSQTWRAHHRPERCFEVYGLTLDESHAQWIAPDFPVRAVTLRDPKSDARLAAAYWFQSATRTTDDYGTRIWADTTGPAERWVLVSILYDRPVPETDARIHALYQTLQRGVAQELNR